MTPEEAVTAVRELHHVRPEGWSCGAISVPMVHKHQFSGRTETKSMKCSLTMGHVGAHKDAACCYEFEKFDEAEVIRMEPRDQRTCTCGERWPCPTGVLVVES